MLASISCNMDKKIRIHIQVGEARYPLWVDRSEEPLFREAARMVNRRFTAYSTKFRSSYLTPETILAMSAIDLAVLALRHEQRAGTETSLAELNNVADDLEQFLDDKPE